MQRVTKKQTINYKKKIGSKVLWGVMYDAVYEYKISPFNLV